MSEYHVIKGKMTDQQCLESALKELGIPFESHKEAQQLYGFEGKLRTQKAHIIIRRQDVGNAANDVGFLKTTNGTYEMIISEYDIPRRKKITHELVKTYGKLKAIKELKRLGCFAIQTTHSSKGIKIKASYT